MSLNNYIDKKMDGNKNWLMTFNWKWLKQSFKWLKKDKNDSWGKYLIDVIKSMGMLYLLVNTIFLMLVIYAIPLVGMLWGHTEKGLDSVGRGMGNDLDKF